MSALPFESDPVTANAARLADSSTGWLAEARYGVYPKLKRGLDILASTTALACLAPLIVLVCLLVKLDSSGPVFFSQTRVGRRGRPFRCWKLRSMYIDAEERKAALAAQNEMSGGTTFKMKRDPRITRVGRVIRKMSIDELPQLFNVLRGDMSLVGPRPPVPGEVADYTPTQRQRLAVRPGITCIWQVSGRSDIPFPRQVELDIEYISKRSLTLDIRLLLETVPAVVLARGAY